MNSLLLLLKLVRTMMHVRVSCRSLRVLMLLSLGIMRLSRMMFGFSCCVVLMVVFLLDVFVMILMLFCRLRKVRSFWCMTVWSLVSTMWIMLVFLGEWWFWFCLMLL